MPIKIIISGLDNAGKTSILTAFTQRYDFEQQILELKPTRKVEYHQTTFLDKNIAFWDMGGQGNYLKMYGDNPDRFFGETNLIIHVIDIQDSARFKLSREYLNKILEYFEQNSIKVPLIVAFHKFDPDLEEDEEMINNAHELATEIMKIEQLEKLFIQTSIYNVFSIVQLISTALSLFYDQRPKLKGLFEEYLDLLACDSLILFDQNGVIIVDTYSASIDSNLQRKLVDSIKDQIVALKKVQEQQSEVESQFNEINDTCLMYLHQITFKKKVFYLSALIKKAAKQNFVGKSSKFIKRMKKVLKPVI